VAEAGGVRTPAMRFVSSVRRALRPVAFHELTIITRSSPFRRAFSACWTRWWRRARSGGSTRSALVRTI
jgi:hypothetical protein